MTIVTLQIVTVFYSFFKNLKLNDKYRKYRKLKFISVNKSNSYSITMSSLNIDKQHGDPPGHHNNGHPSDQYDDRADEEIVASNILSALQEDEDRVSAERLQKTVLQEDEDRVSAERLQKTVPDFYDSDYSSEEDSSEDEQGERKYEWEVNNVIKQMLVTQNISNYTGNKLLEELNTELRRFCQSNIPDCEVQEYKGKIFASLDKIRKCCNPGLFDSACVNVTNFHYPTCRRTDVRELLWKCNNEIYKVQKSSQDSNWTFYKNGQLLDHADQSDKYYQFFQQEYDNAKKGVTAGIPPLLEKIIQGSRKTSQTNNTWEYKNRLPNKAKSSKPHHLLATKLYILMQINNVGLETESAQAQKYGNNNTDANRSVDENTPEAATSLQLLLSETESEGDQFDDRTDEEIVASNMLAAFQEDEDYASAKSLEKKNVPSKMFSAKHHCISLKKLNPYLVWDEPSGHSPTMTVPFTIGYHHLLSFVFEFIWLTQPEDLNILQTKGIEHLLNDKLETVRKILKFHNSLENISFKRIETILTDIQQNKTNCLKIPETLIQKNFHKLKKAVEDEALNINAESSIDFEDSQMFTENMKTKVNTSNRFFLLEPIGKGTTKINVPHGISFNVGQWIQIGKKHYVNQYCIINVDESGYIQLNRPIRCNYKVGLRVKAISPPKGKPKSKKHRRTLNRTDKNKTIVQQFISHLKDSTVIKALKSLPKETESRKKTKKQKKSMLQSHETDSISLAVIINSCKNMRCFIHEIETWKTKKSEKFNQLGDNEKVLVFSILTDYRSVFATKCSAISDKNALFKTAIDKLLRKVEGALKLKEDALNESSNSDSDSSDSSDSSDDSSTCTRDDTKKLRNDFNTCEKKIRKWTTQSEFPKKFKNICKTLEISLEDVFKSKSDSEDSESEVDEEEEELLDDSVLGINAWGKQNPVSSGNVESTLGEKEDETVSDRWSDWDDESSGTDSTSSSSEEEEEEEEEEEKPIELTRMEIDAFNQILDDKKNLSVFKLIDLFRENEFNTNDIIKSVLFANIKDWSDNKKRYITLLLRFVLFDTNTTTVSGICKLRDSKTEIVEVSNKAYFQFIKQKFYEFVPSFKIIDGFISENRIASLKLNYNNYIQHLGPNNQFKLSVSNDTYPCLSDINTISHGLYAKIQIYVMNTILHIDEEKATKDIKGWFLSAVRHFDGFVIDESFNFTLREINQDTDSKKLTNADIKDAFGYNDILPFLTFIRKFKTEYLLIDNEKSFMGELFRDNESLFNWQKTILTIITGTDIYGRSDNRISTIILNLPTGVGKTWLMYYIILEFSKRLSIMYVAPDNVCMQMLQKLSKKLCFLDIGAFHTLAACTRMGQGHILGSDPSDRRNHSTGSRKLNRGCQASGRSHAQTIQDRSARKYEWEEQHKKGYVDPRVLNIKRAKPVDITLSQKTLVDPRRINHFATGKPVYVIDDALDFKFTNCTKLTFQDNGNNFNLYDNGEKVTGKRFSDIIYNLLMLDKIRTIQHDCFENKGTLVIISATLPSFINDFTKALVGEQHVCDHSNDVHQAPQDPHYVNKKNELIPIPLAYLLKDRGHVNRFFQRALLGERESEVKEICKELFSQDKQLENMRYEAWVIQNFEKILECIRKKTNAQSFDLDEKESISSLDGLQIAFDLRSTTSVFIHGQKNIESDPELLTWLLTKFIDLDDLGDFFDHLNTGKVAADYKPKSMKPFNKWIRQRIDILIIEQQDTKDTIHKNAKVTRYSNGIERKRANLKKANRKEKQNVPLDLEKAFNIICWCRDKVTNGGFENFKLEDFKTLCDYIEYYIIFEEQPIEYYRHLSKTYLPKITSIQFILLALRINPFIENGQISKLLTEQNSKGYIVWVNGNQSVPGHDNIYEYVIICSDLVKLNNRLSNIAKSLLIQNLGRNARAKQKNAKTITTTEMYMWGMGYNQNDDSNTAEYELYMKHHKKLGSRNPIIHKLLSQFTVKSKAKLEPAKTESDSVRDDFASPLSLKPSASYNDWEFSQEVMRIGKTSGINLAHPIFFSKGLFHEMTQKRKEALKILIMRLDEKDNKKHHEIDIKDCTLYKMLLSLSTFIDFFIERVLDGFMRKNVDDIKGFSKQLRPYITYLEKNFQEVSSNELFKTKINVLFTGRLFLQYFSNLQNKTKEHGVEIICKSKHSYFANKRNYLIALDEATRNAKHNACLSGAEFNSVFSKSGIQDIRKITLVECDSKQSIQNYFDDEEKKYEHARWQMWKYFAEILFVVFQKKLPNTNKMSISLRRKEFNEVVPFDFKSNEVVPFDFKSKSCVFCKFLEESDI